MKMALVLGWYIAVLVNKYTKKYFGIRYVLAPTAKQAESSVIDELHKHTVIVDTLIFCGEHEPMTVVNR